MRPDIVGDWTNKNDSDFYRPNNTKNIAALLSSSKTTSITQIDLADGKHDYWPGDGWTIDPKGLNGGPWKDLKFKIVCGNTLLVLKLLVSIF